jgi:hypothetical protein
MSERPLCPCCGSETVLVTANAYGLEPGYYCKDWYSRGDHEGCEFDDPIQRED